MPPVSLSEAGDGGVIVDVLRIWMDIDIVFCFIYLDKYPALIDMKQ